MNRISGLQRSRLFVENRKTLALAAPMIAGQLGQMLMGWVDTVMIGQVGVDELAASSLANMLTAVVMVFGFGVLSSVSVKASHAYGGNDRTGTARAFVCGDLLAAGLGVCMLAVVYVLAAALPWMGQPEPVTRLAGPYFILLGWSMAPMLLLTSSRNFSEALGRPWPPFWFMLGGVALNALLNWMFIYGNLGCPAMGLNGAGLATLLARIASAVALIGYVRGHASYRPFRRAFRLQDARWEHLHALLSIGLPVGIQLLCEIGAFGFATVMIGWIGVDALAAHQIAITCAATTFMVPLGLAMAVTVRVGHARGAGSDHLVRAIAFGSVFMSMAFMACTGLIFLLFRHEIASLFIRDPAVAGLAAHLLLIAAVFQLFDGAQVTEIGALRGLEDVRTPTTILIASYWLAALPTGAVLAFLFPLGVQGIWWGLALGLALVAAILARRLAVMTHG